MIHKKRLVFLTIFLLFFYGNLWAEGIGAADYTKSPGRLEQINALKEKFKGYQEKIDLKFSNTDIKSVLKFFSSEFGLNVITSPEVAGEINISLDKVSLIDAFDTILSYYGYYWYIDNNIIKVYTDLPIKIFNLNYALPLEVAGNVKGFISKGDVQINAASNSLIIKAPEADLKKIEAIIKQLDVMPKQVLVEVRMLELQAGFSESLGLDISMVKGSNTVQTKGLGQAAFNPNQGLFVKIINQDFESFIQAIKSKTDVNILARPKILALNNKTASLITGQRLGYKTAVTTTGASGGVISETVQFLDVGTRLTFTPHISDNNDILMIIRPEVSEGTIADGVPNQTTTQTDTTVLVKDGQTILIGGLIRERETKSDISVPILSSIPFIDSFFKHSETVKQKIETIVLIKPTLVTMELLEKINAKDIEIVR